MRDYENVPFLYIYNNEITPYVLNTFFEVIVFITLRSISNGLLFTRFFIKKCILIIIGT